MVHPIPTLESPTCQSVRLALATSRIQTMPRFWRPDDSPVPAHLRCLWLLRPRRYQGTRRLNIQDTITLKNLTLNLGLRGDKYNGLTSAGQAEPRWCRLQFQAYEYSISCLLCANHGAPFNENLVLASNGCNDSVINALETLTRATLSHFAAESFHTQ